MKMNTKKKIALGLSVAVVFQFSILTGMYVLAALPLWTGTEIRLKTIPVDPRSMFRGNYVQLRYEISELESDYFPESEMLRDGEVVYISLEPDTDGLFEFSKVTLDAPQSGSYLRGRVEENSYANTFWIKYGIEAFFVPEEKARAMEKWLGEDGGIAVIMVSDKGRARLKNVVSKPS